MRLWSLHPQYLDRQGLIACWREALLAQAVLAGRTKGYTKHPQLERFRETIDSVAAIGEYLSALAVEADTRGYRFDRAKIDHGTAAQPRLAVTTGQLALEWWHLSAKLAVRDPGHLGRWSSVQIPDAHPLFEIIQGPIAAWERAEVPASTAAVLRVERHDR